MQIIMTEEGQAGRGTYWLKALTIIVVALFGFMFIGPVIGTFLALPLYDGSVLTFMDDLTNPFGKENMKLIHYIVQGSATFIGLAVVPALYWRKSSGQPLAKLLAGPRVTVVDAGIVMGIVVFFMGFNSIVIEWNANIDLPDFLGSFESFARQTEDTATALTKYLTEFSTVGQFVVGFVVIAVLAGIGEELVFRGMLQPTLQKATGNIHAAIWISAILFSCLHLQFYGFVPRVFLGALFGYLYFWSGNLLVPMFAHFVNNGFSVIMIYMNKTELAGVDLENPEAAPWPVATGFTLVTIALLWYFKKRQAIKTATP
jgi:membrane protease YdiL (CAAX protease family)